MASTARTTAPRPAPAPSRRRPAVAALACLGVLAGREARAEPSPSERAIAEQLYDRGRAQLADGDTAAACDSFAESNRVAPGTGILLNLAACHEQQGRLASAWVEFREALVVIRREERPDRHKFASERLAAIEPRLAFLTIEVTEGSADDAPEIALDGGPLGRPAWGVGMPVDAGAHHVVSKWSGGRSWSHHLHAEDGHRYTVRVPGAPPRRREAATAVGGRLDPGCAVTASETSPCALAAPPVPAPQAAAPSPGPRRRAAGWTLGAAGAGALMVGGAFGLRAALLWSDRNRACPLEECSPEGLRLGEQAFTSARISTWSLVVGAATMGVAALMLWGPARADATPASPPRSSRLVRVLGHLTVDAHGQVALGGAF